MSDREKPGGMESAGAGGEVSSARSLLATLEKACKASLIYLSNNPLRYKFTDDFISLLAGHLSKFGDLHLSLDDYTMSLRSGEEVYANSDRQDSISFRMYAEGMRSLTILEGITKKEAADVVEVLSRIRAEEEDDDIVTDLWMMEMPHLSFTVVEEYRETAGELGERPDEPERRAEGMALVYQQDAAEPSQAMKHVMNDPRGILSFSEEELKRIDGMRRGEEERDPMQDVSDILTSILKVEENDETFREFLAEMGKLCRDLLVTERVRDAAVMAGVISSLADDREVASRFGDVISSTRGSILDDTTGEALLRVFDREEQALDKEGMRRLVAALGRENTAGLCSLLGRIEKREMRRALVDELAAFSKNAPEDFEQFLGDERWYFVRNIAHILRVIGTERAGKMLAVIAGHGDYRVRREVSLYFIEHPHPSHVPALIAYLDDEKEAIRTGAAKALARIGGPAARSALHASVEESSFRERSLQEKEALYEALGTSDRENMLPLLRDMILRRRVFNREKEREDLHCAVAGLKGAGGAEVIEILHEARSRKKGDLRAAVERALAAMGVDPGEV